MATNAVTVRISRFLEKWNDLEIAFMFFGSAWFFLQSVPGASSDSPGFPGVGQ
jgi:hypothetical protein